MISIHSKGKGIVCDNQAPCTSIINIAVNFNMTLRILAEMTQIVP